VSRLGTFPIIVVHDTGHVLNDGFLEIVAAGGRVQRAPSYRQNGSKLDYAARNTPGSLLEVSKTVADDVDFLVLCDPDMIFVRAPSFVNGLSGDFYSYINFKQEPVQEAARKLGLADRMELQGREFRCGVPHVIPKAYAGKFAEAWLQAVDAFSFDLWERSMYAFGFASLLINKPIHLTHITGHNGSQHQPVKTDMIHYCYGNEEWSKRAFGTVEQAAKVWTPAAQPPSESILGEIIGQICEARTFYHRIEI
jgi:hypothetical protein